MLERLRYFFGNKTHSSLTLVCWLRSPEIQARVDGSVGGGKSLSQSVAFFSSISSYIVGTDDGDGGGMIHRRRTSTSMRLYFGCFIERD